VIDGWSCDTEAVWRVKVLLPGHHHQIFQFGDPSTGSGQTASAYNDTVSNDWCGGLSGFPYRRKVVLNNSAQAGALTDFPASVQLTDIGDLNNIEYSKTQDSGQDVRFCDQDNATRLEYEIEKWNESATSTIWVRIPNITAASSTEHIWMYYGNVSTTTAATTTGVWDENYVMVQHLSETSGTHVDSTRYNNDSTAIDVAAQGTTGMTGGADDFELDSTDEVTVAENGNSSLDLTAAFTLESWATIESAGAGGSFYDFVEKYVGATQYNYVLYTFEPGLASGEVGISFYNGADRYVVSGATTFTLNKWYYFAGTFDDPSNDLIAYQDGTSVASDLNQASTLIANAAAVTIGGATGGSHDGLIDEVRISNIARSADWLKFTNCNVRLSCTSYGSEENAPNFTPTITSVTDSPDPVMAGNAVSFSVDWSDANAGENVKVKICKTNSLTGQNCDGGYWATSTAFTTSDPEAPAYTAQTADIATSPNSYYAFVCDDEAACSSSSSGSFSVTVNTNVDVKARGGGPVRVRGGGNVKFR
jgi:hypothetical protein